jgi:hypothetical protein
MMVLKMHHKAVGYSLDDLKGISPSIATHSPSIATHRIFLDDLKGISPSIATHRIFMEEGAQPVGDFQWKLKPEMKEVVIKEIIHILDASIFTMSKRVNG